MKQIKVQKLFQTKTRSKLFKKVGKDGLKKMEQRVFDNLQDVVQPVVILETPARARLRQTIGEKELKNLEINISSPSKITRGK